LLTLQATPGQFMEGNSEGR